MLTNSGKDISFNRDKVCSPGTPGCHLLTILGARCKEEKCPSTFLGPVAEPKDYIHRRQINRRKAYRF